MTWAGYSQGRSTVLQGASSSRSIRHCRPSEGRASWALTRRMSRAGQSQRPLVVRASGDCDGRSRSRTTTICRYARQDAPLRIFKDPAHLDFRAAADSRRAMLR